MLKCALDVQIEGLDASRVMELMQTGDDEALFRCLFLAQCDELSSCIPGVFDRVGSAMELLLPDGLLRQDSVIDRLVTSIPEEDWEHVEILGWMYQYYNAEVKDAFFKSKAKETPDTIGPATQLFTPEWIVRYMVENSLGRLWMLNFPESMLCQKWDYYIAPDAEHEDFIRIDGPEDITLCDPACGSGHILVYAFQLLFDMYAERGYREREIPQLILEKNLAGMEIDPRAAQIANLALAMCAREHDRRFFGRGVQADVLVVAPTKFQRDEAGCVIELPEDAAIMSDQQFIEALEHLDEVGSLLNPTEAQLAALRADTARFAAEVESSSLFKSSLGEKLQDALRVCEALARKFDCVVANPPYMGSSSFSPFMSKWIKKNYPDVKSDLCTCFIERAFGLACEHGYSAMVTMASWMFLGSFEKMRESTLNSKSIIALLYMGHGLMRIAFNTCATVFFNGLSNSDGVYTRLEQSDMNASGLPSHFPAEKCGFYRKNAKTFTQIPGTPIAYWASDGLTAAYTRFKPLGCRLVTREGMATADNDRFVHCWWESTFDEIGIGLPSCVDALASGASWFPYQKGGDYRKWFGNNELIVFYKNDGYDIKHNIDQKTGRVRSHNYNGEFAYREGLTWSALSSSRIHARFSDSGSLFDSKGAKGFTKSHEETLYALALINSAVASAHLSFLAPTLDFKVGDIIQIPDASESLTAIVELSKQLIFLSRSDYDSFETSWDFKRHPLL